MAEKKSNKTNVTKKRFLTVEEIRKQNNELYKKLTKKQKEELDRTVR